DQVGALESLARARAQVREIADRGRDHLQQAARVGHYNPALLPQVVRLRRHPARPQEAHQPMRTVRLLATLALGLLAVLLAGCPASLSERAGPPASVNRALELEHSGDLQGAARVYEELAAKNSGADRNDLLLHAAQDYLAARNPDNAARV